MSDFTLIFSFYCNSISRRKYLNFCIQSILRNERNLNVRVFVVDGSDEPNHKQNIKLFRKFKNIKIIHDEEVNPILRLSKHMDMVETEYCFKILEDCLFVDYDLTNIISQDIKVLQKNHANVVIQYPTLIDENINVINNCLYYKKPENYFSNGNEFSIGFYSRLLERAHHNYLCNNILYNTNFLKRHLRHYSKICSGHAAAESDRFDKLFFSKYNSDTKFSKLIKLFHSKIFGSNVIRETLVSENYETGAVIHIGYESTELDYFDNPDRVYKENSGVIGASTLANLEKLSGLLRNEILTISEMEKDEQVSFNNNFY